MNFTFIIVYAIGSGAQTINISTIPCPYEGKQTISLIYENNILNLSCQSDCSIIYSWGLKEINIYKVFFY